MIRQSYQPVQSLPGAPHFPMHQPILLRVHLNKMLYDGR